MFDSHGAIEIHVKPSLHFSYRYPGKSSKGHMNGPWVLLAVHYASGINAMALT
jgi:hypothetical protein